MNKEEKHTKGFADAEELFSHLESKEKAARRAEWLKGKANPSKDGKERDVKTDA